MRPPRKWTVTTKIRLPRNVTENYEAGAPKITVLK